MCVCVCVCACMCACVYLQTYSHKHTKIFFSKTIYSILHNKFTHTHTHTHTNSIERKQFQKIKKERNIRREKPCPIIYTDTM